MNEKPFLKLRVGILKGKRHCSKPEITGRFAVGGLF
jgi:hypothetical protein